MKQNIQFVNSGVGPSGGWIEYLHRSPASLNVLEVRNPVSNERVIYCHGTCGSWTGG
jgi:hypothetical protein